MVERFQSRIGPTDRRILAEFTEEYTVRILYDVPPKEIVAFVDKRHLKNKAETKERYISSLCAFLNRQVAAGQYEALPEFIRDQQARNPTERATRDVSQFRISLLEDIIDAAHITMASSSRWNTSAAPRVSSILHGAALRDLDMEKMVLTFRKTKNRKNVPVALPE